MTFNAARPIWWYKRSTDPTLPLLSYRYLGRQGWIDIKALDMLDAINEVHRVTGKKPERNSKLEVWNGTDWVDTKDSITFLNK